ncbi:MAG: DUF1080 domain-containing protein [Agriterribacter sp.]
MKKIILSGFALSVLALSNVHAQNNGLSAAEKKAGWKLLFDGTTTNGWHSYGKTTLGEAWDVQDGALHLGPHEGEAAGGDATTADEYGNFELKLDWKISPNGNSGVIFLVNESPEYERSYLTGPEMQVLDNNGHPDAKIIKHRAGDLYDLITSKPENVKPVGEWNSIIIKLKNGKLELWQNGAKVVSTTIGDEAWNKLVAGSKFKNMPGFAKAKQGRIVLQDHGNEVWYKNIKIREL